MNGAKQYAQELSKWYTASAKPVFEEWGKERVAQLDAEFQRLYQLRTAGSKDLAVCFLGHSGVGKSTLINALVGERTAILPAGGIGPLTAQATSVRYAASPYFRAEYLPAGRLSNLLFALERNWEARERKAGRKVEGTADDIATELDSEERSEAEAVAPGDDAAPEGAQSKLDGYERQARLLVHGDQFKAQTDLPYMIDCLRVVLGRKPRWGTAVRPEDLPRVESLKRVVELVRSKKSKIEKTSKDGAASFRAALHDHASGHLAPLIKTLEVGWDAKFLEGGLVLVDLPGLGVANDEYRTVTNDFIRQARAIVLVVDRAGVGEQSAQLLHSTGFLNALLHESHDPDAEPVTLMVAVVKIDLTAEENWRNERQELGEQAKGSARKRIAHFQEACTKSVAMVKEQLRIELARIAEQGPEATRAERRAAIDQVLAGTSVHPVSALEYRKLLLADEEDPPWITTADDSRIPELLDGMQQLAISRNERLRARLLRLSRDLAKRVSAALKVIKAQWQDDSRAEEEIRRLEAELDKFLEPLQREFSARRGSFREFLRSSIPEQIEARVGEATGGARADIGKYLRRYEDYHWATLRAAVRRGGAYEGSRHVDLPNELALRFEEPVAVVWSKHILSVLRKRTGELGQDYVASVGSVVEWARGQGARVQPKLVEALHEELKASTKDLASVGKEAIDDLKAKVRTQLASKVQDRVRKRCLKFCEERKNEGPGVKARILKLFREDLTDAVVEVATPAAVGVLKSNYANVEADITGIFGKLENPLDSAKRQILSSHEERLRRSDKQKQKSVLASVDGALAAVPTE